VQPIASSSVRLSWFNNDAGFITTDSTASTTLLSDTNYWSGGNIFTNSTTTNFGISNLYAIGSGGIDFHSNNGTPIADFGAGGGAGATFFGGVNVNGTLSFPYSSSTIYSSFITASTTNLSFGGVTGNDWTDFCVSITGSASLCDGDDASGAGGSSAYEIATTSTIAVPQVAYFTQIGGRTTLGSVATGTISVPTGLTVTANRYTLGGATAIGLDTGYVIPLQSTLDAKALGATTITINGTANQITSSAGAQDLSANRTWTLSFPNQVVFPQYASTTNGFSTPYASTTALHIGTGQGFLYAGSGQKVNAVASSSINLSSLNNDLANLTALDTSLTFSGSYNGSVARTVGLNTGRTNTWSVLQNFNYSSSTAYSSFLTASSTNLFTGFLTLSTSTAGTLKVASNGVVWSDTSGGGAGYSTIQDEGSGLTARSILNFTGSGVNCVDNSGSSRTDCTINAGAATAGGSNKQIQFNDSTALGGASGLEWDKDQGELSLASGNTLLLGDTATSSTSQLEVIKNGILGWFASTTGATIRPIFHIFRNTTTGISGIGINSSSTEDALTINGFANFDPQIDGCAVASLGSNVTTDQLAGQFCDGMAVDSITDGGILQDTISRGTEVNMPFHTVMRTGDTTSWAANEGVWIKTQRALSATTTLMAELWVRTPNTNVSTTTGTYMFGLANAGSGSLTTTAAYANTTNMCAFQASSTANWIAIVKRDGTFNEYVDTGIATSTTQSTFRRFRIRQNYVNGCTFYVDGVQVASETAANSPVGVMQVVWGIGNNGAGTGTVGTASNHYFMYAEPKIGWGRWQQK